MSALILAGHDIEPYLPRTFSDDAKERVYMLALEVEDRIAKCLDVAFRYHRQARIVTPGSLFLQESTPIHGTTITHPQKGFPYRMKVYTQGARKAVGIDALEVIREKRGPNWWKTFHLDKFEELRLLDDAELEYFFSKKLGVRNVRDYTDAPKESPEGFVRNWNYWFRTFLVERESDMTLK